MNKIVICDATLGASPLGLFVIGYLLLVICY